MTTTEADILTILNGLSNIVNYIKNFEKDFDNLKIDETPELTRMLGQAKRLVDDFYTHASNIKELFYTKCVLLSNNIENNPNSSDSTSNENTIILLDSQKRLENLADKRLKISNQDANVNKSICDTAISKSTSTENIENEDKQNIDVDNFNLKAHQTIESPRKCFNDVFAMIEEDLTDDLGKTNVRHIENKDIQSILQDSDCLVDKPNQDTNISKENTNTKENEETVKMLVDNEKCESVPVNFSDRPVNDCNKSAIDDISEVNFLRDSDSKQSEIEVNQNKLIEDDRQKSEESEYLSVFGPERDSEEQKNEINRKENIEKNENHSVDVNEETASVDQTSSIIVNISNLENCEKEIEINEKNQERVEIIADIVAKEDITDDDNYLIDVESISDDSGNDQIEIIQAKSSGHLNTTKTNKENDKKMQENSIREDKKETDHVIKNDQVPRDIKMDSKFEQILVDVPESDIEIIGQQVDYSKIIQETGTDRLQAESKIENVCELKIDELEEITESSNQANIINHLEIVGKSNVELLDVKDTVDLLQIESTDDNVREQTMDILEENPESVNHQNTVDHLELDEEKSNELQDVKVTDDRLETESTNDNVTEQTKDIFEEIAENSNQTNLVDRLELVEKLNIELQDVQVTNDRLETKSTNDNVTEQTQDIFEEIAENSNQTNLVDRLEIVEKLNVELQDVQVTDDRLETESTNDNVCKHSMNVLERNTESPNQQNVVDLLEISREKSNHELQDIQDTDDRLQIESTNDNLCESTMDMLEEITETTKQPDIANHLEIDREKLSVKLQKVKDTDDRLATESTKYISEQTIDILDETPNHQNTVDCLEHAEEKSNIELKDVKVPDNQLETESTKVNLYKQTMDKLEEITETSKPPDKADHLEIDQEISNDELRVVKDTDIRLETESTNDNICEQTMKMLEESTETPNRINIVDHLELGEEKPNVEDVEDQFVPTITKIPEQQNELDQPENIQEKPNDELQDVKYANDQLQTESKSDTEPRTNIPEENLEQGEIVNHAEIIEGDLTELQNITDTDNQLQTELNDNDQTINIDKRITELSEQHNAVSHSEIVQEKPSALQNSKEIEPIEDTSTLINNDLMEATGERIEDISTTETTEQNQSENKNTEKNIEKCIEDKQKNDLTEESFTNDSGINDININDDIETSIEQGDKNENKSTEDNTNESRIENGAITTTNEKQLEHREDPVITISDDENTDKPVLYGENNICNIPYSEIDRDIRISELSNAALDMIINRMKIRDMLNNLSSKKHIENNKLRTFDKDSVLVISDDETDLTVDNTDKTNKPSNELIEENNQSIINGNNTDIDLDHNISNNVTECDSVKLQNEIVSDHKTSTQYIPKIKVVDLEKLIDHSRKDAYNIDSSVIILSSSDEESSNDNECSYPDKPKRKKKLSDKSNKKIKLIDENDHESLRLQKKRKNSEESKENVKKLRQFRPVKSDWIRINKKIHEDILNNENVENSLNAESNSSVHVKPSHLDRKFDYKVIVNCVNMKKMYLTKNFRGEYLDGKLYNKVYVPLPKIDCKELQNHYKNKRK